MNWRYQPLKLLGGYVAHVSPRNEDKKKTLGYVIDINYWTRRSLVKMIAQIFLPGIVGEYIHFLVTLVCLEQWWGHIFTSCERSPTELLATSAVVRCARRRSVRCGAEEAQGAV